MASSLESRPRILIGTLFCGESQIDKCKEAVRSQKYVNLDQFIVADMASVDAHNTLWSYWNEHRNEYDMLVKVDADMVLVDDTIIHRLYEAMRRHQGDGIQAALHDYFTDDLIFGVNCFANTVYFEEARDDYMCDRTYKNINNFILGTDPRSKALGIGAYHAPDPTPQQAFHFGMYRAFKRQQYILDRLKAAYDKHKDEGRKWALIGARSANANMLHHTSYLDEEFQKAFEEAKAKDWTDL